MTRLSRFARGDGGRSVRLAVSPRALRAWIASCIPILASGCFFYLPLVEERMNQAPVIVSTNPEAGDTIVLSTETTLVWVLVDDEDDDPSELTYLWTMDGEWEMGPVTIINDDPVFGSVLELSREEQYDGRQLRCRVYDSGGGSTEVSWPVEVPAEAR